MEENVLIYTIIRIEPREKLFKWVCPVGKPGRTSLYRVKGNTAVNPKNLDEARAFSIVANLASMDEIWLQYKDFKRVSAPPKVENAIKMLFAKGRADLIAFDDATIEAEFKEAGHRADEVEPVLALFETPPYLGASLSTPEATLKKLKAACDPRFRAYE
jgi:polar amino acid transport system substrate-binding protein